MSGDSPITTGSAANGAIHSSDPFVSLQNVNPSTNITSTMPTPVQGQEGVPPLNRPVIEEEMGDGSGSYEQNGEHSVQQTPSVPVTFGHVYPSSPVQGQGVPPLNRPTIEEEMGDGSGGYQQNGEHSSTDQDSVQQTSASRKRIPRHSPHQIQELEALFAEYSHPNPEQRLKLSRDLGLRPEQVQYWFQNKRTKTKVQGQEGVPPLNRPVIEEEMGDGSGSYELNGEHSVQQTPSVPVTFGHVYPSSPVQGQEGVPPLNRPTIEEDMGDGSGGYQQNGEHSSTDQNSVQQTSASRKRIPRHSPHQIQELEALFAECSHPNLEQRSKLSRDLGLRPEQVQYWFQNKRTKTKVKEARSQKATLKAERSELISDNNILWGALSRTIACPCSKCSTSGQSIGNAEELRLENVERMIGNEKFSKTISMLDGGWQTMEGAASPIPSPSFDSEAQRMSLNPVMQLEGGLTTDDVVVPSIQARTNLMNLAKRLTTAFRVIISSSGDEQSWTSLSDYPEETIRVSLRRATEPGHAVGLFLSAVSTIQLPYSHHQVFDFLRDERRRDEIDNPFNNSSFHEVAHSADGSHPGSRISLLRIGGPPGASMPLESAEFLLQESFGNESESVVAYTSLDEAAAGSVMTGTDTSIIPIHPVGYVIAPLNQINTNAEQDLGTSPIQQEYYSGCLLTIVHQILASPDPHAEHIISYEITADQLRSALHHIRATISSAISFDFVCCDE